MAISRAIFEKNQVAAEMLRPWTAASPPACTPDIREHGWSRDGWPPIQEKVMAADILVLGTPIWLADKSSVCKQIIERL